MTPAFRHLTLAGKPFTDIFCAHGYSRVHGTWTSAEVAAFANARRPS